MAESHPHQKPKNYLFFSLCVTLLGAVPFGLIAILFGWLTDTRYASGNDSGAQWASEKAKLFANLTLAVDLFIWVGILHACFA